MIGTCPTQFLVEISPMLSLCNSSKFQEIDTALKLMREKWANGWTQEKYIQKSQTV